MTNTKFLAATALGFICAIALVSCVQASSASSGGSSAGSTTTLTLSTAADIIGTWKRTTTGTGSSTNIGGTLPNYKTSYTYVKEITTTVNDDVTYQQQTKTSCTSKIDTTKTWTDWNFTKGSLSIKDNVATFSQTNTCYIADSATTPTISWMANATVTTTNVHFIKNQLCFDALKRQDASSGFTGTWVNVISSQYSGGTKYFTKEEYVISSTVMTANSYSSSDGTFAAPQISASMNYIIDNGTASFAPGYPISYILEGDWIFFGTGAVKTN